jgi:hypothetical protein
MPMQSLGRSIISPAYLLKAAGAATGASRVFCGMAA